MALSQEDIDAIGVAITTAMRKHVCRFPEEVSGVVGMFETLGAGNIAAGIREAEENHRHMAERRLIVEEIAKNHAFVKNLREGVAITRTTIIKSVAAGIFLAVCAGLTLFFREKLYRG